MEWEAQQVNLISQVLCRLELPDQAVYPALVAVREAVRNGNKISILRTTKVLTDTFLDTVRQGLAVRSVDSPWAVLAARPELQSLSQELRRRASGLQMPISVHGPEFPKQVHLSIMEFETTFEDDPWLYHQCRRRILQSLQCLILEGSPSVDPYLW